MRSFVKFLIGVLGVLIFLAATVGVNPFVNKNCVGKWSVPQGTYAHAEIEEKFVDYRELNKSTYQELKEVGSRSSNLELVISNETEDSNGRAPSTVNRSIYDGPWPPPVEKSSFIYIDLNDAAAYKISYVEARVYDSPPEYCYWELNILGSEIKIFDSL